MTPPNELLFDIETLINSAQPRHILLLGNVEPDFLQDYVTQKKLLNQECQITHISVDKLDELWALNERFDVGLALNIFEHIDRETGNQVLSRLRDVLTSQYCVALPLAHQLTQQTDQQTQQLTQQPTTPLWQLTDLFGFALSKVASYDDTEPRLTLFKYNINDYKKTPDWLNADNWANPQLWGKYWW